MGLGERTRNISCRFVNAAMDLSDRRIGTAAGLHRTTCAIGLPGLVEKRIGFRNAAARVPKCAPVRAQRPALRAAVFVAFFVPPKVTAG